MTKYTLLIFIFLAGCTGKRAQPPHNIFGQPQTFNDSGVGYVTRVYGYPVDYSSNAYYFKIAISDSGFFFLKQPVLLISDADTIPKDGMGIWRPSKLPLVIKTRHYKITFSEEFDSTLSNGTLIQTIKP